MGEVDIDALTMEQYLAFIRGKQAPGVNDDAHEHVERVLDIVSLFNTPGVTHDAIMLHVPPSKTAKQLEKNHNFKQEGDETLYQAWERYSNLLKKCPTMILTANRK
ncbi:hypothetical protein Tco_0528489 [Tanacetum coccineum]